MGHIKLLLSKGGILMRGDVDRVGAGLGGVWRIDRVKVEKRDMYFNWNG